jgi:2'-5' RNA ligase
MPNPPEHVRSFIAINLPPEVQAKLAEFQREFNAAVPGDDLRWTQPEQIHLTLKFLGNIAQGELSQVEDALRRGSQGVGPFAVRARGAGCFPDLRRPRILWVGFDGALDYLMRLQAAIARETGRWGEREEREFHPHLTLGRVKKASREVASALGRHLEQARPRDFGSWQVEQVDLMQSDLSSAGPRYTRLAGVRLAPGPA